MDEFPDDDFNDLNDTVLQELENNAIQSTQFQKPTQAQAVDAHAYDFEDDDLDDTVVIDEQAQPLRPAVDTSLPIQQPRHAPGTQRWNQHLASRPSYQPGPQYPPRRPIPPPTQSQRYSALTPARPQPVKPSQFARPPLPVPRPYPGQPSQAPRATGLGQQNDIIAELKARLSTLESDLTAAKGEAAILRSKFDRAQATHEAEIARLKKQNAEEIAKQERIAEEARAAENAVATELQFARQDLREELGRVKSRRRDAPATPKKSRTWGQADGFDGVEILSSPSKGQTLRRKDSAPAPLERTPTKGKRKRPIVDSPTFALETHSGDATENPPIAPTTLSRAIIPSPLPFDFLKLVLNHSTLRGQPPTFDLFSRFAFPSDPSQTFASIIFHRLPHMGDSAQPMRVLADFAELVLEMWQRCLSERYHAPIYYLAALVLYTLEINTVAVAPHIISLLIPVCATTCRLVALPRLSRPEGNPHDHQDSVVRQLNLDIDVTQCLSLLYLAALGCLPPPETETFETPSSPQAEFWKTMELDFVLVMLSPKHPEEDWFGMLSLLCTSVTPQSIGPIPSATNAGSGRPESKSPQLVAATVIDCVSSFLCEPPRWAPPGSVKDLVVRSAALKTLTMFATSPFGAFHLADSDMAIPRLVTVLCWAVDQLYGMDIALPLGVAPQWDFKLQTENGDDINAAEAMQVDGQNEQEQSNAEYKAAVSGIEVNQEPVEPDPVSLVCRFISQAVRLIHFLATDPRTASTANMSAKLAAWHGGSQRYLLTLARLNFAEEDLVLEAGLDAETLELAHELLEPAVTPDEGEEVGEVFGD